MPEHSANLEIAQHMGEHSPGSKAEPGRRREEILEIAQAVLLALVAISTAWSGYQAARWDSNSSQLDGQSAHLRSMAAWPEPRAGQLYLLDSATFDFWLQATSRGDVQTASLYEARFRAEYRVAFDAWIELDPLHNPSAPPEPSLMPQYHVSESDLADSLDAQASAALEAGNVARDNGDEYVRLTVVLAAVLFLIAVSQRFGIAAIRIGLLTVALLLLAYSVYGLVTFPHA